MDARRAAAVFGLLRERPGTVPDLGLRSSSVVWPSEDASKRGLGDDVETASDHRLVWANIATN